MILSECKVSLRFQLCMLLLQKYGLIKTENTNIIFDHQFIIYSGNKIICVESRGLDIEH